MVLLSLHHSSTDCPYSREMLDWGRLLGPDSPMVKVQHEYGIERMGLRAGQLQHNPKHKLFIRVSVKHSRRARLSVLPFDPIII